MSDKVLNKIDSPFKNMFMDNAKKANRGTIFLLAAVGIVSLAIIRWAELKNEKEKNKTNQNEEVTRMK